MPAPSLRHATGKAYTPTEAAQLAGTTPATVRRWLQGYEGQGRRMEPVFGPSSVTGTPLRLSFIELVEVVVAARFRQAAGERITLRAVRDAHDFARTVMGVEHPFASLTLKLSGGHIIHEFEASHGCAGLALSAGGQWVLPGLVQDTIAAFDYDETAMVSRWWPAGRDQELVVDPRFGGGKVTIAGTGIAAETIYRRHTLANESVRTIARDLGISAHAVADATRYYHDLAA